MYPDPDPNSLSTTMPIAMQGFLRRLPTILGLLLIFFGFFWSPWVRFSPTEYLNGSLFQFILENVPTSIAQSFDQAGIREGAQLLATLESLGGVPGWVLLLIIPTTNPWVRAVLFSISVTWVFGIVALFISFFPTKTCCIRGMISGLQCLLALVVALCLLTQMPTIDALGGDTNFEVRVIVTLINAHLSEGAWFSWVGLLALAAGGPLSLNRANASPAATAPTY